MTTGTVEIIKLQADEGMVLTNGETYSSPGGIVYLAANDSPDNWHEVTLEEYEAAMAVGEEGTGASRVQI